MSPRHEPDTAEHDRKSHVRQGPSQDKIRQLEEARHHPADTPLPHAPHKPQRKPTLTKHHPHTQPEDFTYDIDHGAHENRPRPGKIAKKVPRPDMKK